MNWLSRFQAFLQSIPNRLTGSHVDAGEHFTRLSSAAQFPADERLELRRKAARERLGSVRVKADRVEGEK